jgi:hypothetical protein
MWALAPKAECVAEVVLLGSVQVAAGADREATPARHLQKCSAIAHPVGNAVRILVAGKRNVHRHHDEVVGGNVTEEVGACLRHVRAGISARDRPTKLWFRFYDGVLKSSRKKSLGKMK